MNIELLYFDACPAWQAALDNLQAVMQEMDWEDDVRLTRVDSSEVALKHHFVGSPTIRVGGEDIFPIEDDNYALGCRVYQTPGGLSGVPTTEMIRDALSGRVASPND